MLRPKAVDEQGFTVTREEDPRAGAAPVPGPRRKPERWVRQTDFTNDEAVGYLADRLARAGVEEELVKAGALAGDTVLIGARDDAVVFDWEPTITAGAELLAGPRGTDLRLDDPPGQPRRAPEQQPTGGRRGEAGRARGRARAPGRWTAPDED